MLFTNFSTLDNLAALQVSENNVLAIKSQFNSAYMKVREPLKKCIYNMYNNLLNVECSALDRHLY